MAWMTHSFWTSCNWDVCLECYVGRAMVGVAAAHISTKKSFGNSPSPKKPCLDSVFGPRPKLRRMDLQMDPQPAHDLWRPFELEWRRLWTTSPCDHVSSEPLLSACDLWGPAWTWGSSISFHLRMEYPGVHMHFMKDKEDLLQELAWRVWDSDLA
jgi:hypothetical protein